MPPVASNCHQSLMYLSLLSRLRGSLGAEALNDPSPAQVAQDKVGARRVDVNTPLSLRLPEGFLEYELESGPYHHLPIIAGTQA